MKAIVIYFSQTGNTEKVARAIQAGIEQISSHCDLSEIRQVDPLRLQDYDLIGTTLLPRLRISAPTDH